MNGISKRHGKQVHRKPMGIARMTFKSDAHLHNLRCPKSDCPYLAKATGEVLALGRLRCPVHNTILKTREERGETRGRAIAA